MGIADTFYTGRTSGDVADCKPGFAILPVGAFEQHGDHLPLTTDTLIAGALAAMVHEEMIQGEMGGLLLPPLPVSCSQEHHAFAGSVWVSHKTLAAYVEDVYASLCYQGIKWLLIVNGHGGNYVLGNVVQELNLAIRAAPDTPGKGGILMGPSRRHWQGAMSAAKIKKSLSEDMHGGEIETSVLMHVAPDMVREGGTDTPADDRRFMGLYGLGAHSKTGVVGAPSKATAEKGEVILKALASSLCMDMHAAMSGAHNS